MTVSDFSFPFHWLTANRHFLSPLFCFPFSSFSLRAYIVGYALAPWNRGSRTQEPGQLGQP
jgi:hypothetical protein